MPTCFEGSVKKPNQKAVVFKAKYLALLLSRLSKTSHLTAKK